MLVTPYILEELIIDEDILGKVPQLKFVDHDITDLAKFPKIVPLQYLSLKVDPLT
jgi:muconolactone delta-isomerase